MRPAHAFALPPGRRLRAALAAGIAILLATGLRARADEPEVPPGGRSEESLQEIARQLTNPVTTLWTLNFENTVTGVGGAGFGGVDPDYVGILQPVVPIGLSRFFPGDSEWARSYSIISELTIPFVETFPDHGTGFGDIQLAIGLAPVRRDGFVWALGPTFIFPSASSDALGQGKWQAGPAAVAGYMWKRWTAYAYAQQWWSFAGDKSRPRTSQLSLEYVLLRQLPGRWQAGMQPTLTVDWTASSGNRLSLPVGLGAGRTIRIGRYPVLFWLEADYYPVRPDDFPSPRWGITFQISPAIPQFD